MLEYNEIKPKGKSMNTDLKLIKKHYGENMMHLCRQLFPTILEEEGLLSKTITDTFAPNHFLYEDIIESEKIEDFKNYIYKKLNVENECVKIINETPKELLDEAGYYLYECKTEKDIQSFKKYYALGEELCTFNGGRLNTSHVFFAVKKDVDQIKRKKFKNPDRQDEYGTSVISIQFTKGKVNTLSIKNRYNHIVRNPDATFSNNLENIIEGLTQSFEKKYNLNINQNTSRNFELNNYVKANDGKYYKYNYEIHNIYYCPNNIIIENFEPKQLEKEKYILLDYFILDLVNKKIFTKNIPDSFTDGLENITKINIKKIPNSGEKEIELILKEKKKVIIRIDETNRIVEYTNDNLIKIKSMFLCLNTHLRKISLANLESCSDDCLYSNIYLEYAYIPKLKIVGNNLLYKNRKLKNLYAFELKKIGDNCLQDNTELYEIIVPKLENVGRCFLYHNRALTRFRAQNLKQIGDYCLYFNIHLKDIYLPNAKEIGNNFLGRNEDLEEIDLPQAEIIGDHFMEYNVGLKSAKLPKVKQIGNDCLPSNRNLTIIEFPNASVIGENFLFRNLNLKKIYLPKAKRIGKQFLGQLNRKKRMYVFNLLNQNYALNGAYFSSIRKVKLYAPKIKKTTGYKKIKRVDSEYKLYETSIQKLQRIFLLEKPKQKVKTMY